MLPAQDRADLDEGWATIISPGQRSSARQPLVNKPGLATNSVINAEGHMRLVSFARTTGRGPSADAISLRLGKKSYPVFLLPREPVVREGFVWGAGGWLPWEESSRKALV